MFLKKYQEEKEKQRKEKRRKNHEITQLYQTRSASNGAWLARITKEAKGAIIDKIRYFDKVRYFRFVFLFFLSLLLCRCVHTSLRLRLCVFNKGP